ncbi:Gfo/Idh/MocA family oxidoreductase [Herbaspirillum frisingense]|uniref:Gfo/Idh/MocA family protein n=1 Tax=Herbaspirillum frisingense TaxID=92645 RepID=UPI00160218B3|nr:Gfo/Idh/MocA family oxidoreductase [Herbaspirillum frisingense]QNB06728.1 Gfo/Idh/MocA family oxidoreductase [Herbaspirillum frisingense]
MNNKLLPSGEKIRVGVIGAGAWAEYGHFPAIKLLPQYELTAIYSRSADKAAELQQRHGFRYIASTLDELVNHAEVDLVLVLTPAPQHEEGIRAAIAAKKDVYCEWPLTPGTALSKQLFGLANKAGVRTLVGLQRRLAPGYRYLRDLIDEGEIGDIRSVRLHISVEYFSRMRSIGLYYTVPEENFSSILAIYGGHYLDVLFHTLVGYPDCLQSLLVNQFKEVTFKETGVTQPHRAPDQVVISGTFPNDAVLTVHLEAGKQNNYGIQLDITGTDGDLRLTNTQSFGEKSNLIEMAVGMAQPLQRLDIPSEYEWLPPNELGASTRELANLYAAHAHDVHHGTKRAPTFADAIRIHELMDQIVGANASGKRVNLNISQ